MPSQEIFSDTQRPNPAEDLAAARIEAASVYPEEIESEQKSEHQIFDRAQLSAEQQGILTRLENLITQVTETYHQEMRQLLHDFHKEHSDILTAEILEKLNTKGYFDPRFTISLPNQEQQTSPGEVPLRSFSGKNLSRNDSFLLTFNLGRPFARYWYKEQGTHDGIPWGDFYRAILPHIWSTLSDPESPALKSPGWN